MNLYLRKDGRYESRVPNGKKPDGKRAFLYVLARTKNSVSSVFKQFINTINLKETAL